MMPFNGMSFVVTARGDKARAQSLCRELAERVGREGSAYCRTNTTRRLYCDGGQRGVDRVWSRSSLRMLPTIPEEEARQYVLAIERPLRGGSQRCDPWSVL